MLLDPPNSKKLHEYELRTKVLLGENAINKLWVVPYRSCSFWVWIMGYRFWVVRYRLWRFPYRRFKVQGNSPHISWFPLRTPQPIGLIGQIHTFLAKTRQTKPTGTRFLPWSPWCFWARNLEGLQITKNAPIPGFSYFTNIHQAWFPWNEGDFPKPQLPLRVRSFEVAILRPNIVRFFVKNQGNRSKIGSPWSIDCKISCSEW